MRTLSGQPKPEICPPGTKQRRLWVRYDCALAVRCREVSINRSRSRENGFPSNYNDLGKRWPAKVLNISRGGLKLEVGNPFRIGAQFFLELDSGPHSRPRTLVARVKHINCKGDNRWAIGCAFTKPLSDQELTALRHFWAPGCQETSSFFRRAGRFFWNGLNAMLTRSSQLLGLSC